MFRDLSPTPWKHTVPTNPDSPASEEAGGLKQSGLVGFGFFSFLYLAYMGEGVQGAPV